MTARFPMSVFKKSRILCLILCHISSHLKIIFLKSKTKLIIFLTSSLLPKNKQSRTTTDIFMSLALLFSQSLRLESPARLFLLPHPYLLRLTDSTSLINFLQYPLPILSIPKTPMAPIYLCPKVLQQFPIKILFFLSFNPFYIDLSF